MIFTVPKKTARITLSFFLFFQIANSPVFADAFQDGINTGNSANQQIFNGTQSNSSATQLPSFGATAPSNLSQNYPGNGKDGPEGISAIMQKGNDIRSTTCAAGDQACAARDMVNNRYSGTNTNSYDSIAKSMRSRVDGRGDPEAIAGMGNLPNSGGDSVCVEQTTTLPNSVEQKECMEGKLQQITTFAKYPVTTGATYTQPVCIDSSFSLTGDLSACQKTTYSCPKGGTLNGNLCKSSTKPQTIEKYISCESPKDLITVYSGSIVLNQTVKISVKCSSNNKNMEVYYNNNLGFSIPFNGGVKDSSAVIPAPYANGSWPFNYHFLATFCDRNTHICNFELYHLLSGDGTSLYSDFQTKYTTLKKFSFQGPKRTTEYVCPNSTAMVNGLCTITYPATPTLHTATPGCLGAPVYTAGQKVADAPVLVNGTQSGGTKTCSSTTYSCPVGMAMNGGLCEDTDKSQFEANPDCINLGYKPSVGQEGFLCVTKEIDECSALPSDCTLKSSECVWTDQVPGSPTYGQCISTNKTYDCPVPGQTVTSQNCSFEPMCFNGNCFDQEKQCPSIPGVNPSTTSVETCDLLTKEDINTCSVVYEYGEPDTNGVKHIIGGHPPSSCEWLSKSNCTLIPYKIKIDKVTSDAYWPSTTDFSCLSDTMDLCDKTGLGSDPECSLQGSQTNLVSATGVPIGVTKSYKCVRPVNMPLDTCTNDFAQMAVSMETAREAGNYIDQNDMKIFGGESHRCDRRSVTWGGSNLGSKSCCNITAPDPQSNNDIMGDIKQSVGMSAAKSLVSYAIDTGSSYVYDFMMQSETFSKIAGKISAMATSVEKTMSSISGATSGAESASSAASGVSTASVGVSYAGVGISYGAGAAGTTTALGTTSYGIGGGFNLTFNPYMFAIVAVMKIYGAYQAALACDEEDYKTATLSKGKLCYQTRTYCEKKDSGLFGSACRTYRTMKCCYNSKLARIINQQGRRQLGLDMKNCDGFTVTQLQSLDWGQIDLSEFIAETLTQAQKNLPDPATIRALADQLKTQTTSAVSSGKQPINNGANGQKPHN